MCVHTWCVRVCLCVRREIKQGLGEGLGQRGPGGCGGGGGFWGRLSVPTPLPPSRGESRDRARQLKRREAI